MSKHKYSYMGEGIPYAPILNLTLTTPIINCSKQQILCKGFLDTGCDFTLIPISLASKAGAKFTGRRTETTLVGVGGASIKYINCTVGVILNSDYYSYIDMLACPDEDIYGRLATTNTLENTNFYDLLIGRDFINQFSIKLDGNNLTFTITKPTTLHPKVSELSSPASLSQGQR